MKNTKLVLFPGRINKTVCSIQHFILQILTVSNRPHERHRRLLVSELSEWGEGLTCSTDCLPNAVANAVLTFNYL